MLIEKSTTILNVIFFIIGYLLIFFHLKKQEREFSPISLFLVCLLAFLPLGIGILFDRFYFSHSLVRVLIRSLLYGVVFYLLMKLLKDTLIALFSGKQGSLVLALILVEIFIMVPLIILELVLKGIFV